MLSSNPSIAKQEVKPVTPATQTKADKKPKRREKKFPSTIAAHFTDDEKKLYLKDTKDLSIEEAKQLIMIKQKVAKYQAQIVVKKIQDMPKNKMLAYAKCIFAEELLAKNPNTLKDILDKEFAPNSAKALTELAKHYKLNLNFKVKAEKKDKT